MHRLQRITKWALIMVVCSLHRAAAVPPNSNTANPETPHAVSVFQAGPDEHYPFRQNMYRALQLPDGRVIALSIARSSDYQQTMQGRYSTDQGQTWSEPEDLFQWPRQEGGFGLFDALVDHEGEIHIWILGDANSGILYPKSQEAQATRPGQILDIWYVRSRDHRTKWEPPKAIWRGHGSDLLSVIQLRDGRLLLPFAYARDGRNWGNRGGGFLDYTFVGAYSVSSLYSDDGGATWKKSADDMSVQTPDLSTYGADEPVVIQLNDGRVWMLMRTQRGRFYQSFSSDGGATWSAARPTSLISSDSPAGLVRLKNGDILLFSNACLRYPYAYGARNVLHVAVSSDEGKTWRGFREVARDPLRNEPPSSLADYGLAYTFPTLLSDGRILFSNWVESGRQRTFRRFDPRWIYETHQASEFAKGIDDWSVFGSKGVSLRWEGDAKVLEIRKADQNWPSAAVWNFPVGKKGTLQLEVKVQPGFGGALLGFTDHFSVPWDLEDSVYNVFNLAIASNGEILPNVRLSPGTWHKLVLAWDTSGRHCRISLDGKLAGMGEDTRKSSGINYLRLRSTATTPDQGIEIRSVAVDVSASWPRATEAGK